MDLSTLIKQLKEIEGRIGGDHQVMIESDGDNHAGTFEFPVRSTFEIGDPIKVYISPEQ